MSRTWTATKKPMSRDRLIGCDALLSVFWLDERGHDVESRRCGHPILLPSLDGATADSARIGKLLGAPSELGADRLDSGSVVQKRPVIREDDGLPVGRRAVVGRHSHGSELVGEVSGELGGADGLVFRAARLVVGGVVGGLVKLCDVCLSLGGCLKGQGSVAVARHEAALGLGSIKAAGLADHECGGGSGHYLSGWSVASLPLTRTTYAILRKSQQLFTQTCVISFCRPARGPLNASILP